MIKALTREYLANYPYIRDVIAKDEKKLQRYKIGRAHV